MDAADAEFIDSQIRSILNKSTGRYPFINFDEYYQSIWCHMIAAYEKSALYSYSKTERKKLIKTYIKHYFITLYRKDLEENYIFEDMDSNELLEANAVEELTHICSKTQATDKRINCKELTLLIMRWLSRQDQAIQDVFHYRLSEANKKPRWSEICEKFGITKWKWYHATRELKLLLRESGYEGI